jgi:hypothetical protein
VSSWVTHHAAVTVEVQVCALLLIAAGRGPARIPTCEHTLRHHGEIIVVSTVGGTLPNTASVAMRALSLFGPGEVRALRVSDARIFSMILEKLQAHTSGSDEATPQMISQVFGFLCAVELAPPPWFANENGGRCEPDAAAIIDRCAATVTELQGPLSGRLLCQSDLRGHPSVLARCTRLEVLTHASLYTPAVWLGLSQLHTLHDVDFNQVSAAAVAAALPRLHTLTAFREKPRAWLRLNTNDSAAVAGFFTDLLPRLRVFRFQGVWPTAAAEKAASPTAPPSPLPVLEELKWVEPYPGSHFAEPTVLRGFLGARPKVLSAPYELIAECLQGRNDDAPGEQANSLLARVCDLQVPLTHVDAPFDASAMAQVLLAAPRLRTFGMHTATRMHLRGDTSWLSASDAPLPPAFMGLVHPRLRRLHVLLDLLRELHSRDGNCASRLRRTCFPRLREMRINDETVPVAN